MVNTIDKGNCSKNKNDKTHYSVSQETHSELALSCHRAINDTLVTSKNSFNF